MSSENLPFTLDLSGIIDDKHDERARVQALQSFLDDGGHAADTELEQLENNSVINEELAALDEQCPYMNEMVHVSGDVRIGYYDDFQEVDAEQVRHLTGTPLIARGFSVQPMSDAAGGGLRVGHLFEVPGTERVSGASGLMQQTTTYFAFAPYDSIDIEAVRTPQQRHEYLESMVPDLIMEIDELLYDAPTPLAAVLRLRKLSVDRKRIPADIIREVITYVTDAVSLKDIPLATFDLTGTRSIDIDSNFSITAPYDKDDYTGGRTTVVGKLDYVYLSPYVGYVDGEMYQTDDWRWAAGIAVEAAPAEQSYLTRQTLDIMVADIHDAALVVPDIAQTRTSRHE